MAIALVYKGTSVEYSSGDDTNPVDVGGIALDNSSGTPITDSDPSVEVQLLAQDLNYTSVVVTMEESENFVFLFSLNNATFVEDLIGIEMDATTAEIRRSVWVKARISNGYVMAPGFKITDKIVVNYTIG